MQGVAFASEKPEIFVQLGHSSSVKSVAFSPDGRYALSGSDDKTIKLWDVATGRQIRTFTGHTRWVSSVAFSPDGRYALSGSGDTTLKLWDVATGREIRTFTGHTDDVFSVAFSPDGGYALSGNMSGALKLWDVATGREIRTFAGHTRWVRSVAFSPDGRYALSGSDDKTIKLWDVATGRQIRTFTDTNWVSSVAFSPDGRYALSGSRDQTIRLWDVSTGREVRTLRGHSSSVNSVAFSPDGRYALSGSDDKTIKLWDVSTGREVRTLRGHSDDVNSVAFSPDGRYALSGSYDTIKLWDVSTGRETCTMVGFNDGEWVVITPEGYFNASPNGAKHLNVRIGNNVYSIDNFYSRFYRPELVQLALAGKELPKGENIGEILAKKPAPSVLILSPETGAVVDKESIDIAIKTVDNGGGIGDINVYLNGSQVANDTRGIAIKGKGTVNEKVLSFAVPLLEGQNKIRVIAFNKEGSMESMPATITIISKAVSGKPDIYAIVAGINEYRNKNISLRYAVPDAKAFAEILKEVARPPLFENVHIKLLSTLDDTTKESIQRAFDGIRKKIRPNDIFVFYNASHGVIDIVDETEQYYLLTSNVLLLSSRHIGRDAMSQKELIQLIGTIPAQKKLIILDTCHAGKAGKDIAIALLQQTRGLTESTAIKLLQRAIGSAVFSASSDTQQALEGYKGHGLFTYAIIEGLKGGADLNKDGYVKISELQDYVEEKVVTVSEQVFKRQQIPTIQTGANFPIGRIK
jgi:WD40 repeat protein